MADYPRDQFREFRFRDELIMDIRIVHEILTAEGDAQVLALAGLSDRELEALLRQMNRAFARYMTRRARARREAWRSTRTPPDIADGSFEAAVRSPFSGQDIFERSG